MKVVLETSWSKQGIDCLTETAILAYLPNLLETGFVVAQDTSIELMLVVGEKYDSVHEYGLINGHRKFCASWKIEGVKVKFALIGWTSANDGVAQAATSFFPTFSSALAAKCLSNQYKTQQIDFVCENGRYPTDAERLSVIKSQFPDCHPDNFGEFCRVSFFNETQVTISFISTDFVQKVFI